MFQVSFKNKVKTVGSLKEVDELRRKWTGNLPRKVSQKFFNVREIS